MVAIDSILGQEYSSKEDIAKAHQFVKKFMHFLVGWLNWMGEHPTTVGSDHSRWRK